MKQTRGCYLAGDYGMFDISGFSWDEIGTWQPATDGEKFSHHAINEAIAAAHAAGGGTVVVPAGTYLVGSIVMRSRVHLHLEHGCVLHAAKGGIDAYIHWTDEPDTMGYQPVDFVRARWTPAVIHGIGLEHIEISGGGVIRGWTEGYGGVYAHGPNNERHKPFDDPRTEEEFTFSFPDGDGCKTLSFKECRHVKVSGITILLGGHVALMMSGCEHVKIHQIMIDSNRDCVDIDCCRNVTISAGDFNSAHDDCLCLKSPPSLGYEMPTENVLISDCRVSGYDEGTVYTGEYKTELIFPPAGIACARTQGTGRVKLGTESAWGFRNISVNNCIFENSRGIAIEAVDGGLLENISFTNITIRKCMNSPIFIRLGGRLRTTTRPREIRPARNITISNVTAEMTAFNSPIYCCLILGLDEEHCLENVSISNVRIITRGGGTKEMARNEIPLNDARWFPKQDDAGNYVRDEHGELIQEGNGSSYPEPRRFCSQGNPAPVFGLYARNVKDLVLRDVVIEARGDEERECFAFHNVDDLTLNEVYSKRAGVKTAANPNSLKETHP